MPNHRNVYISLATSMSKTGKFQLTPLVCDSLTCGYEIFIDHSLELPVPFDHLYIVALGGQLSLDLCIPHSSSMLYPSIPSLPITSLSLLGVSSRDAECWQSRVARESPCGYTTFLASLLAEKCPSANSEA